MSSSDIVRIASYAPTAREVILVAGFPGSGLVGSIAVNYLTEKFGFTYLGCVSSPLLTSTSAAVNGLARPSVRLYEKGNIVALVSDVPIPDEAAYEIPLAVIDWILERARITEIAVLGGVVTGHRPQPGQRPPGCRLHRLPGHTRAAGPQAEPASSKPPAAACRNSESLHFSLEPPCLRPHGRTHSFFFLCL